jgi:hypothetical protein
MKSNNFGMNISSVGILRFLNDIHRKNIYCVLSWKKYSLWQLILIAFAGVAAATWE